MFVPPQVSDRFVSGHCLGIATASQTDSAILCSFVWMDPYGCQPTAAATRVPLSDWMSAAAAAQAQFLHVRVAALPVVPTTQHHTAFELT